MGLSNALPKEKFPGGEPELCIYATGSMARLEANASSDLDAFFVLSGASTGPSLGRIRDVKILAQVVNLAESLGFPDFSNDGEYLSFLHIDDMSQHLGSRHDDYHNAFTARMLLILESKWLFNEEAYDRFKESIIQSYFRDFHKHTRDFKPTFLINDTLRFWRTLCLNYEHGRHWREPISAERKAKGHLSNLKLKFSRMNICFSFIAYLLSYTVPISPEDVLGATDKTPIERLYFVRDRFPEIGDDIQKLIGDYVWFLESTGLPKSDVLQWISDKPNRVQAFGKAEEFGSLMYKIVHHIAVKNDYLRILVV